MPICSITRGGQGKEKCHTCPKIVAVIVEGHGDSSRHPQPRPPSCCCYICIRVGLCPHFYHFHPITSIYTWSDSIIYIFIKFSADLFAFLMNYLLSFIFLETSTRIGSNQWHLSSPNMTLPNLCYFILFSC